LNISEKLRTLISEVISTQEFWIINYYLRSMKKAPHGGVFMNTYPNIFLKYYPCSTFLLFTPNSSIPQPVLNIVDKFNAMIDAANISIEEILRFCFETNPDDQRNPENGNRWYLATCGKIITSCNRNDLEHSVAVIDASIGKINYLDNFDVNLERLICLFICTLVERRFHNIYDIDEIISQENLIDLSNKYGLFDVSNADFERQGFKVNKEYYLYNIFLDTSVGNARANIPKIIEIIKSIPSSVRIFMRCDKNLAVPYSQKVSTESTDFLKWRGITLDFKKISQQLISGKEVVVHSDPVTAHKILVFVKKGFDENGEEFYHFNVEQLWNPIIFSGKENVIITNYIHGTYYPSLESFSHIDFSVNQYARDVFEKKYDDAVAQTGIPIDKYSDIHYKVWCVEGSSLTPEVWSDLVCATLDAPFRKIFMETIGGTYSDVDL
jgi:hypothetical protein